jgi:ribonuclease/clavin/mitogillin
LSRLLQGDGGAADERTGNPNRRDAGPLTKDPTILNVGYKSTNYWVVSAGQSRLLVDLGWYGMWGSLKANLDRMGVPLKEIRFGLATHYHLDHAGAAQDLKLAGVPLLVMDVQVPWIPRIKDHLKPHEKFTEITLQDNVVISCAESRSFLAKIGIAGEILRTPGHSDDHVTLLLDNGAAFTGDLGPMSMTGENAHIAEASWQLLIDKGMNTVYPGHGGISRL